MTRWRDWGFEWIESCTIVLMRNISSARETIDREDTRYENSTHQTKDSIKMVGGGTGNIDSNSAFKRLIGMDFLMHA